MKKPVEREAVKIINPLDQRIGYLLRRVSTQWSADLKARLEPLHLSPIDASVLFVVETNPNITQSSIGQSIGIKRANMAPIIAKLHKLHYVHRVRMDGRSQGIELTDEGRRIVALARQAADENEAVQMKGIDAGTIEEARAFLAAALRASADRKKT